MKTSDLRYEYPSQLVATEPAPRGESRILLIPRASEDFKEIQWSDFFNLFSPGDLLVLNDTRVFKARLVFEGSQGSLREVFFLKTLNDNFQWEVLTKGLKGKVNKEFGLPGGLRARFLEVGKPAKIEIINKEFFNHEFPGGLSEYFEKHGHVPLPPYILALRDDHSDCVSDVERYQTVWAKELAMGSVAAPTASLHFHQGHLAKLEAQGVRIGYVTLHVGAGTFFPIETEFIDEFEIHKERVTVSKEIIDEIRSTKMRGKKVWACGTTVMRALETSPLNNFSGETDIFIKPGFSFKVVDGLLTNFHQPESSLLLLAASFAGGQDTSLALQKILKAYSYAIKKNFRLFSYGDLSVIV